MVSALQVPSPEAISTASASQGPWTRDLTTNPPPPELPCGSAQQARPVSSSKPNEDPAQASLHCWVSLLHAGELYVVLPWSDEHFPSVTLAALPQRLILLFKHCVTCDAVPHGIYETTERLVRAHIGGLFIRDAKPRDEHKRHARTELRQYLLQQASDDRRLTNREPSQDKHSPQIFGRQPWVRWMRAGWSPFSECSIPQATVGTLSSRPTCSQ